MIKNISLVVPANGAIKNSTIQGNFIRCLESGNNVLFAQLAYANGQLGVSEFEIEKGLGFETRPFFGLRLRNTTASDVTVKLLVSDEGAVIDTRTSGALSIGAASSIVYLDPAISTTNIVSGVQVFAANAFRKSATFQPNSDCYINNVGGLVLAGGGTYAWENTQALVLIPVAAGTTVIQGFDETN